MAYHILLVEDDAQIREVIEDFFRAKSQDTFYAVAILVAVHANNFRIHVNFSSQLRHFPGDGFPKLTRTEFRIEKLFDKACFGVFLMDVGGICECLFECVKNGLGDRKPLDTLAAPFWTNLVAGNSPKFFGVVPKESSIELDAKAVYHKIFKAFFFAFGE